MEIKVGTRIAARTSIHKGWVGIVLFYDYPNITVDWYNEKNAHELKWDHVIQSKKHLKEIIILPDLITIESWEFKC